MNLANSRTLRSLSILQCNLYMSTIQNSIRSLDTFCVVYMYQAPKHPLGSPVANVRLLQRWISAAVEVTDPEETSKASLLLTKLMRPSNLGGADVFKIKIVRTERTLLVCPVLPQPIPAQPNRIIRNAAPPLRSRSANLGVISLPPQTFAGSRNDTLREIRIIL